MNKDEQFVLNQKTIRSQLLIRAKNGCKELAKRPWKVLLLIFGFILIIYLCCSIKKGFVFGGDIVSVLAIITAVVWIVVFLIIIGTPLKAFKVSDNLRRIGLVNQAEEPPLLLYIRRDETNRKIQKYVFDGGGIPLCDFEEAREKIEAVMNISVIDFRWLDGKRKILMRAVPAKGDLPKQIEWSDLYLSTESFILSLGEGYVGPVLIDLCVAPHILLGGSTGSGKTKLLKLMVYQCVLKGAKVYIADYKGLDFVGFFEEHCVLCYDWLETKTVLESLMEEKDRRLKLFRSVGAVNIDEYNEKTGENLPRLIFACDEYAQLTAQSTRRKEDKELLMTIEYLTASVARLGRAFGIHLILATQRPDADVLAGQVKNNMDYRICGQADATLSTIILGDGSADTMIPKYMRGRFLMSDGTLFQAYLFSETGRD